MLHFSSNILYYLNYLISGHDNRVGGRNDGPVFANNRARVVSFKAQSKPGKEKHRIMELAFKQHLDDDVQMNVGSNNNGRQVIVRGRGRGNYNSGSRMRGRNSPLPQRMTNKVSRPISLGLGDSNWYRVTVSITWLSEKRKSKL